MKNLNQKGQGMVEYTLIVFLVAILAIAAFKIFGQKVSAGINSAANQVGSATSGSGSNGNGGGAAGAVGDAANAVNQGSNIVNSVTGGH